jgi:MOSC domain-containing protein
MPDAASAPRLSKIRLYPVKSLDPVEVSEAQIGPNGGLVHDRAWALYAADGQWIRGKRKSAIHRIRSRFEPDFHSFELSPPAERADIQAAKLAFPGDTAEAARWFTEYFAEPVSVRYAEGGFPDDNLASGPTIVSTASLEAVCAWFPGITLEQARLRFRANLEIGGVPAFWEDQLFASGTDGAVRFRVGEVGFEGSNPCARCVVPSRNALTGDSIPDFQKRFEELRRAHLPIWSPAARFDHFYRFAVNTRIPSSQLGKPLRLGDPLAFLS